MKKCNLEEFGECCCTCLFRLEDHYHPLTSGETMSTTKGYVCTGLFDLGISISDWGEHGLCEMYTNKEEWELILFRK